MNQKVGILTLGCPRNLVDSETLAGRLNFKGYAIVKNMEEADIAIVNTCAFIKEAKEESVDAILDLIELKKQGRIKKIIVHGCLPQRYKGLEKELPEVDAFVGSLGLNHESKRYKLTPGHYAYLKISEGCVNRCSYCIIPKIKGSIESLGDKSIIEKVKNLNRQGISELNIIGQDITGFGMDTCGKSRLTGILKKIVAHASDIGWIRLLYLNPARIDAPLLNLIASEKKICKYIDLPIQHINNRMLKLMNRGNTREQISALIKKIRKIIPEVCLRTSIIVGFPSETEKEFGELLDFVKETKFERLGAFIYSREEATPAYGFKKQISQEIKQRRFDKLMKAQQEIAAEINSGFMGKTMEVLVEEKEDSVYVGRSQADAPEVDGLVFIKTQYPLKIGEFAKVKITDTLEYDLIGEPVK